jgi:RNA polymerase sigma-70 factor (ECF subfamily)
MENMPEPAALDHDQLLIAAVLNGDKNAFRPIIEKYERLVVSIVFKMVPQREDGEDLCQDIFLKVYEKLPNFRFQSKLSTWIGSIAFNTCINFLQKRKHVLTDEMKMFENADQPESIQELSFRDPDKTPDQLLISKERETIVKESIGRLSSIQKTIIHLFHQDELTLIEISGITGLPVNTVKSHLFRARKQLKEIMDQY